MRARVRAHGRVALGVVCAGALGCATGSASATGSAIDSRSYTVANGAPRAHTWTTLSATCAATATMSGSGPCAVSSQAPLYIQHVPSDCPRLPAAPVESAIRRQRGEKGRRVVRPLIVQNVRLPHDAPRSPAQVYKGEHSAPPALHKARQARYPALPASNRAEFTKISQSVAMGFLLMGFIGYFIKLIHIPINNIIVYLPVPPLCRPNVCPAARSDQGRRSSRPVPSLPPPPTLSNL